MALGEARTLPYTDRGCVTSPVVLGSRWMTVINNAALTTNPGTITNPDSLGSGCTPIRRQSRARVLRVRLRYNDAEATGSLALKVFGKTGSDPWQIVRNVAESKSATITTSAGTDIASGGLRYTNPDSDEHAWSIEGYDVILVGNESAWSTDDDSALLEARMY